MPRLRPRTAIVLSFSFAAAVLAAAGYVLHDATQRGRQSWQAVVHTQSVMGVINTAREQFVQMESAQRGWLLWGDEALRREREHSAVQARGALVELGELTQDNPTQVSRAQQALSLLDSHVATTLAPTAQPGVTDLAQREQVRLFHELTQRMLADEAALLTLREAEQSQRQNAITLALALAMLAAVAVLVPAYAGVLRQWRNQERLEQRMTDLVEQLPVTVWQIHTRADGYRRFVFVSGSVLRERGLSAGDVMRDINVVLDSIADEDRQHVRAAMDRAEQTLRGFDERYRIIWPDGTRRWLRSSAQLRREPDGSILWSGYWQDITETKNLEDDLRRRQDEVTQLNQALWAQANALLAANRELESFSYSVSHDLRSPLHAIRAFAGLLTQRHSAGLGAEARHYLQRISHNAERMEALIAALLDLARASQGTARRVPLDLSALAREVADDCRDSDPARQVTVDIEPDLHCAGEPGLVRQVLVNLIGNAWKFTARVPQARIEVGRSDHARAQHEGQSVFHVRDNGVGFDMARASELFGTFTRLHDAAEYPGMGIGLATVKRIITRHGGHIRAQSQPGQGTTIYFSLGDE